MPQITCFCFNVHMTHRTTLKTRADHPNLPEHKFFDNGFYILTENLRSYETVVLNKEIKELVTCSHISPEWELYKCMGCDSSVYCVHTSSKSYYANAQLITNPDKMQSTRDPNYSKVYKFILPASVSSDAYKNYEESRLPFSIQRKYNAYVALKTNDVEVEIERYRRELEASLAETIKKASEERKVLMALMDKVDKVKGEGRYAEVPVYETEPVGNVVEDVSLYEHQLYEDDSTISPSQSIPSISNLDLSDSDEFEFEDESEEGPPISQPRDVGSGRRISGLGSPATESDDSGELVVPVAQSFPIEIEHNPFRKAGPRRKKRHSGQGRTGVAASVSGAAICASMMAISKSLHKEDRPFGERPDSKKTLYSRMMSRRN